MEYRIRALRKSEYPVLSDFLYEAIFIPQGVSAPPRDIVDTPELQVYVSHFGERPDDQCFAAVAEGRIVGAVWARIMKDYGHIDDQTPSLAISVLKEYRGAGIGSDLLNTILSALACSGYEQVSLAVQKANYALKLYQRAGFEVVSENKEEYIMAKDLRKRTQS